MKLLLLIMALTAAHAQAPDEIASADAPAVEEPAPAAAPILAQGLPKELPPPGPPPPADQVEAITYEVASGLRCPVCQGLSVADSPSPTAVAMKDRVRELVAAGYSGEQIEDYFVHRYGEWVLLSPPKRGLAWALWVLPAGLLGLALAWLASVIATWRREPDAVPLPSDAGLVPKDPYEARLLRELEEE